jgi:hypothetical protein
MARLGNWRIQGQLPSWTFNLRTSGRYNSPTTTIECASMNSPPAILRRPAMPGPWPGLIQHAYTRFPTIKLRLIPMEQAVCAVRQLHGRQDGAV